MLVLDEQLSNCELIGYKGYLSLDYQTALYDQAIIELITFLRSNMKVVIISGTKIIVKKKTFRILFFTKLGDQMIFTRNYAKSLDVLFIRIMCRLSARGVLEWINFSKGKPINDIKHVLAF
jgi:hypothetical protein